MSKNINVNLNPFKIVAIALVAMALSTNSVVWGQTTQNPVNMFTDYVFGLLDFYYPGEGLRTEVSWVGNMKGEHYFEPSYFSYLGPGIVKLVRDNFPADHITRAGNPIYHVEGNHIDSMMMFINPNAVPSSVNVDAVVNRLWDAVYHAWGYTKLSITATIDPSMNCHGYSTGLNTWTSLQPKLADDYEASDKFDDLVSGVILATTNTVYVPIPLGPSVPPAVFPVGSHSAKITEVEDGTGPGGGRIKWITVVEKNRVSALYTRNDFVASEDAPARLGFVKPIVLPWYTLPKFHIKKP